MTFFFIYVSLAPTTRVDTEEGYDNFLITTNNQNCLQSLYTITLIEYLESYRQIIRFHNPAIAFYYCLDPNSSWLWLSLLNYMYWINLLFLLDENVFLHVQNNNEVNI